MLRYTVIFLIAISLFAKSPTKLEHCRHMLDTMNKNGYVDRLIAQSVNEQIAQNPLLSTNPKLARSFALKYLSFSKLKPRLARVYAKTLSHEEIDAFEKFFATKTGQRILLKMPKLIGYSNYIAQKELEKHYPELLQSALRP